METFQNYINFCKYHEEYDELISNFLLGNTIENFEVKLADVYRKIENSYSLSTDFPYQLQLSALTNQNPTSFLSKLRELKKEIQQFYSDYPDIEEIRQENKIDNVNTKASKYSSKGPFDIAELRNRLPSIHVATTTDVLQIRQYLSGYNHYNGISTDDLNPDIDHLIKEASYNINVIKRLTPPNTKKLENKEIVLKILGKEVKVMLQEIEDYIMFSDLLFIKLECRKIKNAYQLLYETFFELEKKMINGTKSEKVKTYKFLENKHIFNYYFGFYILAYPESMIGKYYQEWQSGEVLESVRDRIQSMIDSGYYDDLIKNLSKASADR